MANINRVVLVGNLTKDPELRHTPSGTAVCKLRLAVNTRQKDAQGNWGDKPNYFDVTVWGNQGESCAQYLSKGAPSAWTAASTGVSGRPRTGRSARRSRSSPTRCSSSAARVTAATASGSTSPQPRPPPATRTSHQHRRRRHSVLMPPRGGERDRDRQPRKRPGAATAPSGASPASLQGQGRRDRLQERQPAASLRL